MRYQQIVDRLLVKDLNQRLASARELIEVVDAVSESDDALDYDLSATSA
jgi:hypothetical protein